MRSEAIRQAIVLVNGQATHAWKSVERGLKDADVHVRKSTLRHLPVIPARLREAVESLLDDPSYRLQTEALTKLAASFPNETPRYIQRMASVRSPHAQVEIECAYLKARQGDTFALASLADYAGPSFEFTTRQNAMDAVKRLGVLTDACAKSMLEAMLSTNSRLVGQAKTTISYFTAQARYKELFRAVVASEKLEPWQSALVESLIR